MILGVVGNSDNRRVHLFLEACASRGIRCEALPWETLLENPGLVAPFSRRLNGLRIESLGENARVMAQLIALGGGPEDVCLEFGEILHLREQAMGLRRALEFLEHAECPVSGAPAELWTMMDKWLSHQRFQQADLPRPDCELAAHSWEAFRSELPQRGRCFLKPRWGSSASGVCAYRWTADRQQLLAPIEIHAGRLYNSLRVRSFQDPGQISFILKTLLPQGMIRETWVQKLRIEGKSTDLRVLVINGQARHWTGRQSIHPMTNLHLGNSRLEPEKFQRAVGAEISRRHLHLAERAAACFPSCLHAGVDVFPTSGGPVIGEINAFGDLLPGLTSRGESTYEAFLSAWIPMLEK